MAGSADLFLEELKTLRKGRGVLALKIGGQVGPALRAFCGIARAEASESVRAKVTDRLADLARTLPDDLELAVRAGLALHPQAQQLFLSHRIQWLAEQLDRDERTARRRMDEGLHRLAEAAARHITAAHMPDEGWYVEEFYAVLRLDLPCAEAIERRRIIAERDGIDHIDAMITLPREDADSTTSHDLHVEVVYGATLIRTEHISRSRFRFVLELPTVLRAGDRHEYALLFRVPPRQLMRTHYVLVSPRRCDLFDLRVRFDRARPPVAVWRAAGVFYVGLDDMQSGGEMLTTDKAGEVHQQFRNLKPGFSYGILWKNPPPTRHSAGAPDPAFGRDY
jgi:hypothetical protein